MSIFTARKMTSILKLLETGSGRVLANVREIPLTARFNTMKTLEIMKDAGINGVFSDCQRIRPLYGVPIALGKCGVASYSGINPFAALGEAGIKIRVMPLAAVMNIKELKNLE